MRKFVLTTHSESGDRYLYFITAKKEPNYKELDKFLRKHGTDFDEERTYENVQEIVEITEDKFIMLK